MESSPSTRLEGSARVTYRHWNLDEKREEPIRAWNSYDGVPRSFTQLPAAHDFSLECEVEVDSDRTGSEFRVPAARRCEIAVNAEITVGPRRDRPRDSDSRRSGPLGSIRGVSLEPGQKYKFEFAFVDRRATLAIDGEGSSPTGRPVRRRRSTARSGSRYSSVRAAAAW